MKPMSGNAWPDAVHMIAEPISPRIIVIDMHTFVKGAAGYTRQDIVRQLNGYAQAGDKVVFSMRDREPVQEEVMRRLIGPESSLGHEGQFVFSREELVQKFTSFDIYMDDRGNRWEAPCARYVSSSVDDPWAALKQALNGANGTKAAPAEGMAPAI